MDSKSLSDGTFHEVGGHLDLTVIIVNWNGGESLRDCLSSIRNRSDRRRVRVIVMDNNSGDGSRQMAERGYPDMRVINTGANLGFGKANNLARDYVETDLVLFLNPDTEILEGSLPAMMSFMEANPEVGAVGCRMRGVDGSVHELPMQWPPSPETQFLGMLFVTSKISPLFKRLLPYADPLRSSAMTTLYGGCIMARKTALDEVGWFDERYFMYAEDVDLCHSLNQRGWKLHYLSEPEIVHAAGQSSAKTPSEFSTLMKCESICKLMRKRHGAAGSLRYRLAVLVACNLRLVALAIPGLIAYISPAGRRANVSAAAFKYRVMILWCLKLRKAFIPGNPR